MGAGVSKEGAAKRAAVDIERYWASKGSDTVRARAVVEHTMIDGRQVMAWGVRSNLVNGLPPK